VDRNEDMIRSALRAVDAITRMPNVDTCAPFKALMSNTVLQGSLAPKYRAVREERAEAEGATAVVRDV
jgi:cullin-associated NEDD8-dissociated protein 1